MYSRILAIPGILLCALLLLPLPAFAGTVIKVSTSAGEFQIELFDSVAPATVANFLGYVNSGAYKDTVVHRLVPGFVIQGGWLTFNEAQQSFFEISTGPTVRNEFSVSNVRGTIAMAKLGGDPNSATSQWFINLADNPELNASNGGFTVFGRVMGTGMQVVDAIAALPPVTVINGLAPFPLINYNGGTLLNTHLVSLNMAKIGSTDGDPVVFDGVRARLHASIDAGELGLIRAEFALVSETPSIVIKLDRATLFSLDRSVANIGSFNSSTGRLTIPELRINGAVAYRNVRFMLTDAQQLLFTLEGAN